MQFSDLLKPLNRLCLIAGIDELILVQKQASYLYINKIAVHSRYMLPDYSSPDHFRITAQHVLDLSEQNVDKQAQLIASFLKENEAENSFVVALTDEYKYHIVSLPLESGEDDIWLADNYKKFLPPSLNVNDFIFTFEELYKDENNRTCELVMARKDDMLSLSSLLRSFRLNLIAILPARYFYKSVFSNQNPALIISVFPDKLEFLFKDEAKVLHNTFHMQSQVMSTRQSEFALRISDIKQMIGSGEKDVADSSLKISILADESDQETIKELVAAEFYPHADRQRINKMITAGTGSSIILPVRDFLLFPDSPVNLYSTFGEIEAREELEKKYATRLFLGISSIVFLLLLLFNLVYFTFSKLNDAAAESQSETTELIRMLDLMKKENKLLELETSSLLNLQHRSEDLAAVLKALSFAIPRECAITSLQVKSEKERLYKIAIKGVGYSQEAIARFLAACSGMPGIKETHLLGSSVVDESTYTKIDEKFPDITLPDNMYEFNLTMQYAAAQQ